MSIQAHSLSPTLGGRICLLWSHVEAEAPRKLFLPEEDKDVKFYM